MTFPSESAPCDTHANFLLFVWDVTPTARQWQSRLHKRRFLKRITTPFVNLTRARIHVIQLNEMGVKRALLPNTQKNFQNIVLHFCGHLDKMVCDEVSYIKSVNQHNMYIM
jgi:hypothetical protein